ncbi:unnamed protein product, partial [Mesorhabditis spiculigera]
MERPRGELAMPPPAIIPAPRRRRSGQANVPANPGMPQALRPPNLNAGAPRFVPLQQQQQQPRLQRPGALHPRRRARPRANTPNEEPSEESTKAFMLSMLQEQRARAACINPDGQLRKRKPISVFNLDTDYSNTLASVRHREELELLDRVAAWQHGDGQLQDAMRRHIIRCSTEWLERVEHEQAQLALVRQKMETRRMLLINDHNALTKIDVLIRTTSMACG